MPTFGLSIRRGGEYNRLADPSWTDPLDVSFARERGGRWNPPGRFGVLYLNLGAEIARAQVAHKLRGLPYQAEDLDVLEQHDLVAVQVPEAEYLNCVHEPGLVAVGLPASYPGDGAGGTVGWGPCQAIGLDAHDDGHPGIACRSAAAGAPAEAEELAVFEPASADVQMTGRLAFADWYFA